MRMAGTAEEPQKQQLRQVLPQRVQQWVLWSRWLMVLCAKTRALCGSSTNSSGLPGEKIWEAGKWASTPKSSRHALMSTRRASTRSRTRRERVPTSWVRNKTEAPTGLKDMGTWQMGVYTEEQQARLSVDENGKPKHAAD
eukprot:m.30618 g.30618  ORF g.30618 m.30618 type:complete len:140 (+) comp12248_c0_seq1:919-1338(+)